MLPILFCRPWSDAIAPDWEVHADGGFIVRLYIPNLTSEEKFKIQRLFREHPDKMRIAFDHAGTIEKLRNRQIDTMKHFNVDTLRKSMPDVKLPEYNGKELTWDDFSGKELLFLRNSTEVWDAETGRPYISEEDLAARCGISAATVARWMADPRIGLVRNYLIDQKIGRIDRMSLAMVDKALAVGLARTEDPTQTDLGFTKTGLTIGGRMNNNGGPANVTNVNVTTRDEAEVSGAMGETSGKNRDELRKILDSYGSALNKVTVSEDGTINTDDD